MTLSTFRGIDKELIIFLIEIIETYMYKNWYICESRLPFINEIHLLQKIYFPSEDKHEHMVKIDTQHSQCIQSVVNRHGIYKRHILLKCDDYMIYSEKFVYSQTKLWIPPSQ